MIYNKVKINGNCDVNYVWNRDIVIDNSEIEKLTNAGIQTPVWNNDTIMLANFNSNINASKSDALKDVVGYTVTKKDIKSNSMYFVADLDSDELAFEDYNIKNNRDYKYYITPSMLVDGQNVLAPTIETDIITTHWGSWSVIGLKYTDSKDIYAIDKNNIWIFKLNIKSGDITPVYNKSFVDGFGKYPKSFVGDTDYIKSSLSCLIGDVSCVGDYINDDVDKLEKWRSFCHSSSPKLIRDIKGHVFLADIEDTTKSIDDNTLQMQTEISFNFREIGDAKKVSVYGVIE